MLFDEDRGNDTWTVKGLYVHHTQKAILLNIDGRNHWLPISQIEVTYEIDGSPINLSKGVPGDETLLIEIPQWLLEDKGIEYE
jgi:hypothetical protein